MASEWLETSLGEVTELKRGYDLARRYRMAAANLLSRHVACRTTIQKPRPTVLEL